MGNAESSSFPFKVGEEVTSYQNPRWKLFHGTKLASGEPVSIFSFDKKTNAHQLELAQNALQKIRTLRHPDVLRFIDGADLPTHIHIVTEPILPFQFESDDSDRARQMSGAAKKQARSTFMTLGLHQIIMAISWLNNEGKLIHGNLHKESIFVTKAGDWKLGGFDVTTKHNDISDVFKSTILLPDRCKPPELTDRKWATIMKGPPTAVDAWCLGCLIYECFNSAFHSADQLGRLGDIPPLIQGEYKRLLHTSVAQRLDHRRLLDSQLFQNDIVKCVVFLDNLALKAPGEKDLFFKGFSKHLDKMPERLAKYKILPQLTNALEYGSGMSCFATILTSVLKIGDMLDADEYAASVIPPVAKLFASNERAVRINLLQHLKDFADHLGTDLVTKQIFPHVVSGFTDSLPLLRELTVKSMAFFAPKLAQNTVDSQVVRHLASCQTDQVAAIRTNTTYCLGKIAGLLSPSTREKLLVPAFVRALRDPFPPARIAALKSLGVTLPLHSAGTCCQQVIPAVSPFLMDPVKPVREAALQTCQAVLSRMKTHGEEMSEAPSASANSGGSDKVEEASYAGMAASLGTWAVSSISKQVSTKMATADADAAKARGGHPLQGSGSAAPKTSKPTTSSASSARTYSPPKATKAVVNDGWGDNEDDLFADNDDVLDLSLSLSAKKPAAKIVRKPVSKVVRKASGSTARAGSTAGRAQVKARPAAKKKASILATPVVADVSAELDLDMDMDAWGSKSATQTEAASGGGGWDDLDGWGATDAKTKGKAPAAGNQKKPAAKAETEEWGWD